jgi:hypothetical protein
MAGPFEDYSRCIGASATTGTQKADFALTEGKAGEAYFGIVKGVMNATSGQQTGASNADKTVLLPGQNVSTPAPNAMVAGGRPTLTWTQTSGAVGYLYYVYDKNPWETGATLLWSNFPKSTDKLTASYPLEKGALTSGTYWWWVAGVSFDQNGKADAFSFSDPQSFQVP